MELVRSADAGTTLNLISTPEDRRDLVLSTMAREAVIAAITTDVPVSATRDVTVTADRSDGHHGRHGWLRDRVRGSYEHRA